VNSLNSFYKDKHVQKSINALFNLENEKNFDILLGLGFFIRQKRIEGAVHTIHDDFAQAWPNFRSSWTHQFLKAKINQKLKDGCFKYDITGFSFALLGLLGLGEKSAPSWLSKYLLQLNNNSITPFDAFACALERASQKDWKRVKAIQNRYDLGLL
jgi:hypothetical protein